jgi:hypothetical protein
MAKPNHGSVVSAAAHQFQEQREGGGARGIGHLVREVARDKTVPEPEPDFTDGVITVVHADGSESDVYTTFEAALAATDTLAGDTLQVGAGTYKETINLTEQLHIVGEEGAILDGSSFETSVGLQSTVQLFSGSSRGSIEGLEIIAVQDGGAVQSITGEAISEFTLADNTFDAGANTAGSLVYFNEGTASAIVTDNAFEGAFLAGSPFLGSEATDINLIVTGNEFPTDEAGTYVDVEVFYPATGSAQDVIDTNFGLAQTGDVIWNV